jgi:hypothetical protein
MKGRDIYILTNKHVHPDVTKAITYVAQDVSALKQELMTIAGVLDATADALNVVMHMQRKQTTLVEKLTKMRRLDDDEEIHEWKLEQHMKNNTRK